MTQREGQGTMPPCLSYRRGEQFIYFYFLKKKSTNTLKRERMITLVLNIQILKMIYVYQI